MSKNVPNNNPMLSVRDLKTYYPIKRGVLSKTVGYFKAVDGVDFDVYPGETLGIVGESGCGKSTLARTLVGLEKAHDGSILFEGKSIKNLSYRERLPFCSNIQMIFQDPYSFLNPMLKIRSILAEPLKVHGIVGKAQMDTEIVRLLESVGLDENCVTRYPSEFSGGQRQRIGIARAIAVKPKLLICDEPVSALDVSIQAQMLNLLKDLQESNQLTYIFIAHGLDAVRFASDKVAIMYLGKFVEMGTTQDIFDSPLHPYTRALLNAYPEPDPHKRGRTRDILEGGADSEVLKRSGCRFQPRCRYATDRCSLEQPPLIGADHKVACFNVDISATGQ